MVQYNNVQLSSLRLSPLSDDPPEDGCDAVTEQSTPHFYPDSTGLVRMISWQAYLSPPSPPPVIFTSI